ncbi:MAG: enoyl-CoA hydratase/isomerase family protein [Acidimicrobiales bacterium]|nr:enoyl-CoA hydratase/isomerase family protein [Acidimicrobiales bacterium]MCB1013768.1 enoyl-CoA hydratase/isomerase family protein [Acidimicrobiales bacterium]MCB9372550.1 enoyl-CoA hydratase/isomerase family protein [Microthrixaceae bacterium]
MTDFGPLTLERRDEVALITLTAGDNRFNPTSLAAWHAALDEVEGDDSLAALVTTGTGKFYSNGLDLDWMGSLAPEDRGQSAEMVSGTIRLLGRLLGFPMYTVAAINGHAFAAGAMLTLAHDARVMRTDRGFWCLPEVDLGMPFAPGMAAIVQARLTAQVAHEAVVTGRRYPADEARATAIVDAVAPEDEVVRDAVARAATQAGRGRSSIGQLKRDLYGPVLDVMAEGALPG